MKDRWMLKTEEERKDWLGWGLFSLAEIFVSEMAQTGPAGYAMCVYIGKKRQ
jgi:hypothetical protein